jgi:predicted acetyltransferase
MSNRPFRPFDYERDIKAIERIWIECGWIDDDKDDRKNVAEFFKDGETEVATINNEAECSVHWTAGIVKHQEQDLELGAVTAVTTSHISRKLGFAKELTARSLVRQFEEGKDVSALGMFDQGFYNKVGYGTGPYETLVHFDPTTLMVDCSFRPPARLTSDDYEQVHTSLRNRRKTHGAVDLFPPRQLKCELDWTEKPFGLGYFDGPNKTLSHFIWGEKKNEYGPYHITMHAYQTTDQLMELLALIKSLGDQVTSFRILEFGEFQLQDLLAQPFRTRRATKGSKHEQFFQADAYWQVRILNLETSLEKTHLCGPGVRFNLQLTDPLQDLLAGAWRGLQGDYVIDFGETCSAKPGQEKNLPTLSASINAFSRMWLGVRPASNLAITDDITGNPSLIHALDKALSLPKPHFGWDF